MREREIHIYYTYTKNLHPMILGFEGCTVARKRKSKRKEKTKKKKRTKTEQQQLIDDFDMTNKNRNSAHK
jgi:hypothetical protein